MFQNRVERPAPLAYVTAVPSFSNQIDPGPTLSVMCAGCSREASTTAAAAPAPPQPKLGIRPAGDTEIQPDLSKIQSDDLKKVFTYIDEHIDDHVVNLQKWIRQPSISNSGEGIPESAEMVKGFINSIEYRDRFKQP